MMTFKSANAAHHGFPYYSFHTPQLVRSNAIGKKPTYKPKKPFIYRPNYKGNYEKPFSSSRNGDLWRNVYQDGLKPPWQYGSKYTDASLACDASVWAAFSFLGLAESLALTGLGDKLRSLIAPGQQLALKILNAGAKVSTFYISWIEGPLYWFSMIISVVSSIVMMHKLDKEVKNSILDFFKSFEIMIDKDQKEADHCVTAFASHAAWSKMTHDFWRNAYYALKGITGQSAYSDKNPPVYYSLTPEQRRTAYKDGLSRMFFQQISMYELTESFKTYADLKKKNKNGHASEDDKNKLKDALRKVEENFDSIGNISTYFGNLWGGPDAFRNASMKASNAIIGYAIGAKQWENKFYALEKHYRQNASPEALYGVQNYINTVNGCSKLLGLTTDNSDAKATYAKFLFLVGYGNADEVWNNAPVLYDKFKENITISAFLPSYTEMMNVWANRNVDEAEKNRSKHGLRFPVPSPA